jgi:hypothetical protein
VGVNDGKYNTKMDVVLQITVSDGLDAVPSLNVVPLPSGASNAIKPSSINSFSPGRPQAPSDSSLSFPGFDFGEFFLFFYLWSIFCACNNKTLIVVFDLQVIVFR